MKKPSSIIERRRVLLGLAALIPIPAIVRASSLMSISQVPLRERKSVLYFGIEGWDEYGQIKIELMVLNS